MAYRKEQEPYQDDNLSLDNFEDRADLIGTKDELKQYTQGQKKYKKTSKAKELNQSLKSRGLKINEKPMKISRQDCVIHDPDEKRQEARAQWFTSKLISTLQVLDPWAHSNCNNASSQTIIMDHASYGPLQREIEEWSEPNARVTYVGLSQRLATYFEIENLHSEWFWPIFRFKQTPYYIVISLHKNKIQRFTIYQCQCKHVCH